MPAVLDAKCHAFWPREIAAMPAQRGLVSRNIWRSGSHQT
jgi:hypothetical protein